MEIKSNSFKVFVLHGIVGFPGCFDPFLHGSDIFYHEIFRFSNRFLKFHFCAHGEIWSTPNANYRYKYSDRVYWTTIYRIRYHASFFYSLVTDIVKIITKSLEVMGKKCFLPETYIIDRCSSNLYSHQGAFLVGKGFEKLRLIQKYFQNKERKRSQSSSSSLLHQRITFQCARLYLSINGATWLHFWLHYIYFLKLIK